MNRSLDKLSKLKNNGASLSKSQFQSLLSPLYWLFYTIKVTYQNLSIHPLCFFWFTKNNGKWFRFGLWLGGLVEDCRIVDLMMVLPVFCRWCGVCSGLRGGLYFEVGFLCFINDKSKKSPGCSDKSSSDYEYCSLFIFWQKSLDTLVVVLVISCNFYK